MRCATTTGPSVDMPSAIQAMLRRNKFCKTPEDLQNAAARMSGRATWQLYAHEAKRLWPHASSHDRTLDQLEHRLPWQSPWSIGLCGSSWYPWCCVSSVWTYADDAPPPPPSPPPDSFRVPYVELQLSNRTHSILSGSVGFQWAIPGTVIHSGACVGNWFFASKPGSGNRDTTSCRCVFPLANTHLPGAILNACRYERRLAEANANRGAFQKHLWALKSKSS